MTTPKSQAGPVENAQPTRRPRDAASLVIIKSEGTGPARILMGRRNANQIFLPNKYVFPGGRLDDVDRHVPTVTTLADADRANLLLGMPARTNPARMHGLALTAIRETFEETGLIIGQKSEMTRTSFQTTWQPFLDCGYIPDPSGLRFFARAITPTNRPRRYDTRFFWVDASRIANDTAQTDGELLDLKWLSVPEARERDTASITRHILDDIEQLLQDRPKMPQSTAIPFYRYRKNTLRRVLLSH